MTALDDTTTIAEERCLRLERHLIRISVDKIGGAHMQVWEGRDLIAHLAGTPSRFRSIARGFIRAANHIDPAGATVVLIDVAKFSTRKRERLLELLQEPDELEVKK